MAQSPGRLHDLFMTIEAASPGEFKSGGQGLSIEWGLSESPCGLCSLGWNARGICHLAFHDAGQCSAEPRGLRENWARAELDRNDSEARRWAATIFCRDPGSATPLKAYVRGAPFRLRV